MLKLRCWKARCTTCPRSGARRPDLGLRNFRGQSPADNHIGEVAALDAQHCGRCGNSGVVQACAPTRTNPPLRAQGIEEAEGGPCVWPDLYYHFFDVIKRQAERR